MRLDPRNPDDDDLDDDDFPDFDDGEDFDIGGPDYIPDESEFIR